MKRIPRLVWITIILSATPVLVQAQSAPRQDSSVAIIDSLRPKVIPRHVSPYRAQSRSCHGLSQRNCSIIGALMIGSIGYLAADASSPSPTYVYREDNNALFGESKVCVDHCHFVRRAFVFSLSGASVGGIGGWIVGRK